MIGSAHLDIELILHILGIYHCLGRSFIQVGHRDLHLIATQILSKQITVNELWVGSGAAGVLVSIVRPGCSGSLGQFYCHHRLAGSRGEGYSKLSGIVLSGVHQSAIHFDCNAFNIVIIGRIHIDGVCSQVKHHAIRDRIILILILNRCGSAVCQQRHAAVFGYSRSPVVCFVIVALYDQGHLTLHRLWFLVSEVYCNFHIIIGHLVQKPDGNGACIHILIDSIGRDCHSGTISFDNIGSHRSKVAGFCRCLNLDLVRFFCQRPQGGAIGQSRIGQVGNVEDLVARKASGIVLYGCRNMVIT